MENIINTPPRRFLHSNSVSIMIVAALFFTLFMCANTLDDKLPFCSTHKTGRITAYAVQHNYYLGRTQCSGKVYTVPDPECSLNDAVGVSVKICDENGTPSVSMSDARYGIRQHANVSRSGQYPAQCLGEANVTVTVYCDVPPGPYFLDPRYTGF